jgi:2-polyprenyl-6-methoxyphenol hydroxylase-like FAD-dependent oxidoreductase
MKQSSRNLSGRMVHGPGSLAEKVKPTEFPFHHTLAYVAVDREKLVRSLMNEAMQTNNVTFEFSASVEALEPCPPPPPPPSSSPSKLVARNNVKARILSHDSTSRSEPFDLLIGADGSGSVIRSLWAQYEDGFTYRTWCNQHGYKSLRLFGDINGNPLLDPRYIHTWPRKRILLHAMPGIWDPEHRTNQGYFNCTLIMPMQPTNFNGDLNNDSDFSFMELDSPQKASKMFQSLFPELHAVQGEALVSQFICNPTTRLRNGSCSRFHSSTLPVILIGDAARPVVPYIGSGMTSALEDVSVLMKLFHGSLKTSDCPDWHSIVSQFSQIRKPDMDAMHILAQEQAEFLFESSGSRSMQRRFRYQQWMHSRFPSLYSPSLYNLLAEPSVPYQDVLQMKRSQNKWYNFGRL